MASLQDINQPDPQGPMLSALGPPPQQGQPGQQGMLGGLGQTSPFGVTTNQNGGHSMQWPGPPQAKPQSSSGGDLFGDILSIAIPIAATVVGGPVAGAGATAFMASTKQ